VDSVEEQPISREEYIQKVLSAYRQTPGTAGTIRQPDRLLAAQLQQRSVPLAAVENALVLAAARRILRAPGAPPLGTIRSLAYFSAVIEEVLELRVKQAYFQYLRHRIQRFTQTGRRLPSETKSHTPTRLRRG
jgi:hypothetical protein